MKKILTRLTIGSALVLCIALVGELPVGDHRGVPLADAALGACPITVNDQGSTTWQAARQNLKPIFETNWGPGTTVSQTFNGSGNGIAALTALTADTAASSRPLSAAEQNNKYTYLSGLDEFVIGVKNDATMSFLSAGITVGQLTQIYNAQAGISTLKWSDLVPAIPGASNHVIIPRARITGSGSRPDFDKSIAVPDANENVTVTTTGLPRLTESADMAAAAEVNDDQIVYTSLSQIPLHPGMLVVPVNGQMPADTQANWSTYALPRSLFYAVNDKATVARFGPGPIDDNSEEVRADDWINYVRSADGDAQISASGYITITPAPVPPIPDWDPNMDGVVSIADIGVIEQHWGLTSTCKGWVKADANNDGKVSLGDIGVIFQHFGQDGLICDAAHNCTHPGGPQ